MLIKALCDRCFKFLLRHFQHLTCLGISWLLFLIQDSLPDSWYDKSNISSYPGHFGYYVRKLWILFKYFILAGGHPILKEINPEYSLEGIMLKLQYSGHLTWKANSLERTLMFGKIWGQEEKVAIENEVIQWHHWVSGHESEQTPGDREGQTKKPGMLQSMELQRVERDLEKYWKQNNNY